ncbi:hypothetical protein BGX34_010776 [Mortierella sp. NVP85]|nr:hypothetical protein BGX34_010776 [Mortierella sp. NVP85]
MAKTDIPTPPGTGLVGSLTPDQKEFLKQMWAEMFRLLDGNEASAPADLLAVPSASANAETASVKSKTSTTKKGWFGSKKEAAPAAADESASGAITLAEYSLTTEQLRAALWNNILGDHPDSLMLRFLRARKWNVTNGMNMILKAFKWRTEDDIEEVKSKNEDELDSNDQDPKALEKFTVYVMETGRLMIQPPVETACLVFDMTGFSLSNMDYNFVKFLVQCFEAYYPESLGILLIHKAPMVFWGVWKIIEPWLDPVVASKIRFTRSDKEMTEVIEAEHLPNKYEGGKDQYTYEYIPPNPTENDTMKDTATRDRLMEEWKAILWKFEALTREWIACKKTEGARSEEVIEAERLALTKELRAAYFKVDPYIRARNMYHRANVLQTDGSATWTYKN